MTVDARINGERLWQRLMDMARIGATENGGCNRQALTDLDKKGRDLFCDWAQHAGCTIRVDKMGNIFARRSGTDDTLPPVVSGSHLDTQPTGGKFDGVYGVLAALEVVDTLNENKIELRHPVEIVVWTNEEGARFSPAMIGSGVFGGVFDLSYAYNLKDKTGLKLGDELSRIGYQGDAPCSPFPIKSAFEVHIEQGPILEAADIPIGVVSGVQGMRWFDLHLEGSSVHAGPTPMDMRQDPVKALYQIIDQIYSITELYAPDSRATFGDLKAIPGARNTVPQKVSLAVDIRHPDEKILDQMEDEMRSAVERISNDLGVRSNIDEIWCSPAVEFNEGCVDAVEAAVNTLGYSGLKLVSGAGHDSVYLSRVAPTSMIFIPCKDGISHNEAEDAKPEHITAGANVLLHAVMSQAS